MDCLRCDGPVAAYSIGDRRAPVCERCGWVGIEASLTGAGEDGPPESWDDAIGRMSDRRVAAASTRTRLPGTVLPERQEERDGEAETPRGVERRSIDGLADPVADPGSESGAEAEADPGIEQGDG